MRKIKVIAIMMAAALAFTACSKKDGTPEPTPIPTEAPTETPTQAPEEDPATPPQEGEDGTEDDANTPEDGSGDKENTPENGTGEENLPATNDSLDKAHEAVKSAFGEDYIPNMQYDKAAISELFGVKEEWYDAAIAEGPMISMHVDTFIGVHATEGNLENVQNALNSYREALISDTMQYPMNQLKIQASEIVTINDYVFFVMLGYLEDDTVYDDDEETIAAYGELNKKAIDAIKTVISE